MLERQGGEGGKAYLKRDLSKGLAEGSETPEGQGLGGPHSGQWQVPLGLPGHGA